MGINPLPSTTSIPEQTGNAPEFCLYHIVANISNRCRGPAITRHLNRSARTAPFSAKLRQWQSHLFAQELYSQVFLKVWQVNLEKWTSPGRPVL